MKIWYVKETDIDLLIAYDKHISKEELRNAIRLQRIYIAEESGHFVGWLRYNLFWDNTPFMNLLYILEEHRGKGYGRQMVFFWESEMARKGFEILMTSTQLNEYAQHFYFKLGYDAIGGFRHTGDTYEVIFSKQCRCRRCSV